MGAEPWRAIADTQAGLVTRVQLNRVGVDRWAVRHRIESGRWQELTPTVVATTSGELTREQARWLGVLHGGPEALLGDLTAAEVADLQGWHRDRVTVLVPHGADVGQGHPDLEFRWVRRVLPRLRQPGGGVPRCRLEPAVLLFAARQRSTRTAEGVLAAVVQQRLTTPERLLRWIDHLQPLRGAARFRRVLREIDGGAQSVSEMDVHRMCRRFGLEPPRRQVRRCDAAGRARWTDCEWVLSDGRVLVLEVDGSFHMDTESWEDDIARQRALTAPDRVVVRCTARELRDAPERVARDLRLLGVALAG